MGCQNIMNTPLIEGDQIINLEREDNLQKAKYKLNGMCEKYNLKISLQKRKCMAFIGKCPTF
jgi:hypothetical protein